MIHDQVHDEADPAVVCLHEKTLEFIQCTENRIDEFVIRYVIPAIMHRRFIDRRKPDRGYAKFRKIIEFPDNSIDIANAITVRITVTLLINMIKDSVLPPDPILFIHNYLSGLMNVICST